MSDFHSLSEKQSVLFSDMSSSSHPQSSFRPQSRPSTPSPSLAPPPSRPSSSQPSSSSPSRSRPRPLSIPECSQRSSSASRSHRHRSHSYKRPRGLRICNLLKSWSPVIAYALTSLAFLVAIAFYKTELFACLDELSHWLQADPTYGHAVLFFLIFLTTFPPLPLYSTLIVLSGYTFGAWTGAIISYFAALTGALVVFLLSRLILRDSISRWLDASTTMKRVVRAIEKRPKLLFLIRLAPYPYNVMNCLLAASPTLTLRTYTLCTALSLFKVVIHTSLGASIHSFKDYHVTTTTTSPSIPGSSSNGTPMTGSGTSPGTSSPSGSGTDTNGSADTVAHMWTVLGIALCIAILIYLSYVARKAVNEELDDEEDCHRPVRRCGSRSGSRSPRAVIGGDDEDEDEDEETVAFLSPRGMRGGDLESGLTVDDELEDGEEAREHIHHLHDDEEDDYDDIDDDRRRRQQGRPMVESPFRSNQLVVAAASASASRYGH